jgi:hypothetical protein
MSSTIEENRLEHISTCWVDLEEARRVDRPDTARAARERFLERYRRPILRYVRTALPDESEAEGVFNDFVAHFLAGRFNRVEPARGRFRDYLKASLFNLVRDHRRKFRPLRSIGEELPDRLMEGDVDLEADRAFLEIWQKEFLTRAWEFLDDVERRYPLRPYSTILRMKIQDSRRSAEIARALSDTMGRDLTEQWVRRKILDARQLLEEFLFEQVRATLDQPTLDDVEDELINLKLHALCKRELARRRALSRGGPGGASTER